jgi:hypothetical protein
MQFLHFFSQHGKKKKSRKEILAANETLAVHNSFLANGLFTRQIIFFVSRDTFRCRAATIRIEPVMCRKQGCQMVYFQTKNHDLGKLWRTLK